MSLVDNYVETLLSVGEFYVNHGSFLKFKIYLAMCLFFIGLLNIGLCFDIITLLHLGEIKSLSIFLRSPKVAQKLMM